LRTIWATALAFCCAIAVSPLSGQTGRAGEARRLYVEPFTTPSTTNAGPERFREDLISELRKLGSISLVSSEAGADLILGGGGEIWVKGYRSLNPRSGRLPSDGTPVYAGYLSVELRDAQGETLWSDLVTPGTFSGDIARHLSKGIAQHVAEALAKLEEAPHRTVSPPQGMSVPGKAVLKGAGATFPYPVYAKWFINYRREHPEVEITYEPIGSEAGIRRLLSGEVDFGASDSPDAVHELDSAQEAKYLFFPSVVGAVVPIVNLPGVAGEIEFTPEVLAGIYLGKIKKWNDPILRRANPRLHLPDLDIVVIHRADGSGTSYAWTDYLSRISSEWKAQVGAGLAPHWPVGRAASGNEGVAGMVKELGGSIGYVEFIYALQNHLSFGKVRNQNGEYVGASLESIAVAARQAMEIGDDLKVSLANAPGAGAYPIASFTWLVVPAHIADDGKRNAVEEFLRWMLGPGQRQAAALGYLGLPADVVSREEAAMAQLH
jgi:phosphate transport system substrate-binding protein